MLLNEVRYVHRVGPLFWLFTMDCGPLFAARKFHLRFRPRERLFIGKEVRASSPLGGWSDLVNLRDGEVAILRALLPDDELAECTRAIIASAQR